MRISRTIAYAIQAVLELGKASPGVRISRVQLAATAHLPERFLLEVLRSLVTRGIVRSTRGVDGGFALARPADQITLHDIFEAFDFPSAPYVPAVPEQSAAVDELILEALTRATEASRKELRRVSIADLLECRRREEWSQADGRMNGYASETAQSGPRKEDKAFVSDGSAGGHGVVDGLMLDLIAAHELSSVARTVSKRTEASNGF